MLTNVEQLALIENYLINFNHTHSMLLFLYKYDEGSWGFYVASVGHGGRIGRTQASRAEDLNRSNLNRVKSVTYKIEAWLQDQYFSADNTEPIQQNNHIYQTKMNL